MSKKKAPDCPTCGSKARKQETRYGPRYSCCDLYAWGKHPLASPETHRARSAAHAAFDPVWQSGKMTRREAYEALAAALSIPRTDCHMKLMDEETALRVPAIAQELRNT